ncbi:MAG: type III pantothenate kinase [Dissulfuribacterales bacterium]
MPATTDYLAVDIGNTHTVIGLFDAKNVLQHTWRVHTNRDITSDELAVLVHGLLGVADMESAAIQAVVIASVVPSLVQVWQGTAKRYLKMDAVVIEANDALGMPIRYGRPYELGADRIINAIAAFERYRQGLIVVDYGTAITFDCISAQGEYLGGAIAPGIKLAADALASKTAKLPRLETFVMPQQVIAQDTLSALQTGLILGFAGMTDGIVKRLAQEYEIPPKIIATGGLAPVIVPHTCTVHEIVPELTLYGISLAYRRLK